MFHRMCSLFISNSWNVRIAKADDSIDTPHSSACWCFTSLNIVVQRLASHSGRRIDCNDLSSQRNIA